MKNAVVFMLVLAVGIAIGFFLGSEKRARATTAGQEFVIDKLPIQSASAGDCGYHSCNCHPNPNGTIHCDLCPNPCN